MPGRRGASAWTLPNTGATLAPVSESRLIDNVQRACPVGTTLVVGSPAAAPTGPMLGLSRWYRQLQLGLAVTVGDPSHVTAVNIYRGTGPTPGLDAARSAAALAALSAGEKYDLAVDGLDVHDGLKVEVVVTTAEVTVATTLLADTRS